jgi:uncharacterized protein
VVHGLFWFGDVLRYYAVMGFFLIPTIRLRPRTLACLGIAIALFPWTALHQVTEFLNRDATSAGEMMATTLTAFAGSNLLEMLKANLAYDLSARLAEWSFPLALLGRLLIGAAIGRSDALSKPIEHVRTWLWLLITTLPVGVGLTALGTLNVGIGPDFLPTIRGAASLFLGLAYIAIFVLLFQLSFWKRWMSPLIALGRMALTNYLLQTFVAIILFYGIGFGIGPRFGLVGTLPAFAAILTIQIALSQWWLVRFDFGPVEWIWRCLSYGSVIPLRKSS